MKKIHCYNQRVLDEKWKMTNWKTETKRLARPTSQGPTDRGKAPTTDRRRRWVVADFCKSQKPSQVLIKSMAKEVRKVILQMPNYCLLTLCDSFPRPLQPLSLGQLARLGGCSRGGLSLSVLTVV